MEAEATFFIKQLLREVFSQEMERFLRDMVREREDLAKAIENESLATIEPLDMYVDRIGINKYLLANAININVKTLQKRLENPEDFSKGEIAKMAIHLGLPKRHVELMVDAAIEKQFKTLNKNEDMC